MAGHGSAPAGDRGRHPNRQVGRHTYDPSRYTATGWHPEMIEEWGEGGPGGREHTEMSALMQEYPGGPGLTEESTGMYTPRAARTSTRPGAKKLRNYLD